MACRIHLSYEPRERSCMNTVLFLHSPGLCPNVPELGLWQPQLHRSRVHHCAQKFYCLAWHHDRLLLVHHKPQAFQQKLECCYVFSRHFLGLCQNQNIVDVTDNADTHATQHRCCRPEGFCEDPRCRREPERQACEVKQLALRHELQKLLVVSPYWDRKVSVLQVDLGEPVALLEQISESVKALHLEMDCLHEVVQGLQVYHWPLAPILFWNQEHCGNKSCPGFFHTPYGTFV